MNLMISSMIFSSASNSVKGKVHLLTTGTCQEYLPFSTNRAVNVNVLRKDAAMVQAGHACIASAATSRSSFSVAPLAA